MFDFPIAFAPSIAHTGLEELRFAPGFFDPGAPGYWSYAFVWRIDAAPAFDEHALGAELTTYFRGLVDAVDEKHEIADRDSIVVRAQRSGTSWALAAHLIDPFKTKKPIDLVGSARQATCPTGAIVVFSFSPASSPVRGDLDALAARAACGQEPVANEPEKPGVNAAGGT